MHSSAQKQEDNREKLECFKILNLLWTYPKVNAEFNSFDFVISQQVSISKVKSL